MNWSIRKSILSLILFILALLSILSGCEGLDQFASTNLTNSISPASFQTILPSSEGNSSNNTQNPPLHPVMNFTPEQLARIKGAYNSASAATIHPQEAGVPLPKSLSLLPDLKYNSVERYQGIAGNCWVWACTGIMEIALNVQKSVKDRLSIQYFDSNYNGGSGPDWAGNGGYIDWFASFYAGEGMAIPWSNTNASYQDGESTTGASVPANSIGLVPNYPVDHNIHDVRVFPYLSSQATIVTDIESMLVQNEAIYFGFPVYREDFDNFWDNQSEADVWHPTFSGTFRGNHAVLCVGYDTTDLNNPYWIMLNSWGTTISRPNGLFRVSMNMDYDATDWETLENIYPAGPLPPITTTPPTTTPSPQLNVKIQNMTLPPYVIVSSTTSYPTTFKLVNSGTSDVTVSWKANSSVTGDFDSGVALVPKNGYTDITRSYLYTTPGSAKLTYTVSYNGIVLDTWSGVINVASQPNVKIQSVTLPTNAVQRSPSETIFVTTYPTTLTLTNNEPIDITVNWQGHSSVTGDFDSGTVTIPKNSSVSVVKNYYYSTAGGVIITYTISYNGMQLDIWMGGMNVLPYNSPTLPPPNTLLSPPAIVSPASGATIANNKPAFSWTPITGATQYEFQLSNSPSFGMTVFTDTPTSAGTVTPSNITLQAGIQYFWRVRVAQPVQSAWSAVGNFFVATTTTSSPATLPDVKIQSMTLPSNAKVSSGIFVTLYYTTIRLTNNGNSDCTVTWQANSSVTGNFDNGTVTVPKNSYIDVTKGYFYSTAGPVTITYTIFWNGVQLDTKLAVMNVSP